MSCGVGCRHSLDPMLLCLWCGLAAASLIQPLAWELPYDVGEALKRKKEKKKKRITIITITEVETMDEITKN